MNNLKPGEKFPIKDYEKHSYKLTKEENDRVRSLETIMAMGGMAEMMINNYLNNICLPRMKVNPIKGTRLEYSTSDSDLFIYIPRNKESK